MTNVTLSEIEAAKTILHAEVLASLKKFTSATGIKRLKLEPTTTEIRVGDTVISSEDSLDITLYL